MATLETETPAERTSMVPIDSTAPFPGLRAFEPEEAEIFFGREDDIFELLDRLRCVRFLALVGASGCGKSSLMRAGLIAALRDGFMVNEGQPWRIAIMRPGSEPIANLARALAVPQALDVEADAGPDQDPGDVQVLQATLHRGPLGLVEAVREADLPAGSQLLVLVDQFEEIFRLDTQGAGPTDEARAVIKLLLAAALQRELPIYIALTMRSEFLGDCAAFTGLPEAINEGLYLLPQMGRDSLRDAIVQPLALYRASITPQLCDILLNSAGDAPDRLPVLQHAMMRLWDAAEGQPRMFDLRDYKAIGGLDGALSKHVEEVYAGLDPRGQRIAETLFRCVTDTRENNQTVRWPDRLDHIHARAAKVLGDPALSLDNVIAVIEGFRRTDRSFLMPPPPQPLNAATVIDISHEALIRQWERLRKWAEDEAISRALHRQIREAAARWRANEHDPDRLFRGKPLIEAQAWAREHPGELKSEDEKFLNASLEAREREVLQQPMQDLAQRVVESGIARSEATERKIAQIFTIYARQDSAFAQRLRREFEKLGRGVVWTDVDVFPGEEALNHVQSAIDQADVVLFFASYQSVGSRWARAQLEHALMSHKRIIPLVIDEVNWRRMPEPLRNRPVIDFRDPKRFRKRLDTLAGAINSDLTRARLHARLLVRATEWNALGRPGTLLLRGDDLKEAEAWLVSEDLEPQLTPLQKEYVIASRKGAGRRTALRVAAVMAVVLGFLFTVMIAAAEQNARLQEQRTQLLRQYADSLRAERDSAINARNDALAARTAAEIAHRSERDARAQAEADRQRAEAATIAAQSATMDAVIQRRRAMRNLEEVQRQKERAEQALARVDSARSQLLLAVQSSTTTVSPNGNLLAFVVPDGIRLSDPRTGDLVTERFGINNITATAFSPKGKFLAIGSGDGRVRLWVSVPQGNVMNLGRHEGSVRKLVFHQREGLLATSGDDNVARVWNMETGGLIQQVSHENPIVEVAFSLNGRELITSSTDGVTQTTILSAQAPRQR